MNKHPDDRPRRAPSAANRIRSPNFGFADDAVVLLSVDPCRECVLPYHRRLVQEFLVQEFSAAGRIGMHLCGDATRFFRLLRGHLNVYSFDTAAHNMAPMIPVEHVAAMYQAAKECGR
jgi:hypothetical protein